MKWYVKSAEQEELTRKQEALAELYTYRDQIRDKLDDYVLASPVKTEIRREGAAGYIPWFRAPNS